MMISAKCHYSEKLNTLSKNFFIVLKLFNFWVVVVVFVAGPFFNVAGMWLGPFLKDTHNFDDWEAGICQMFN